MKRNTLALLLCAVLLLTACAAPPAETTAPPTTQPVETAAPVETTTAPPETTAPAALTRYPLNVDSAYLELAQELPDNIYTTTGTENGLAGTVYMFTGTVVDSISTEIEGTGVEQIIVETDGGKVMVSNFYKWMYNSAYRAYGKASADRAYPYPVSDYRLPGVGESGEFLAVYVGYSGTAELPVFYSGANPALFEAMDCQDPTQEPPGTKENPYLEGMYKVGSDIPAGEYLFVITDTSGGYVCVSADSNKDDIIENEIVELCWFATVEDGQYLEVRDCAFLHAELATLNINADGSFNSGMYRVGIDIPAGEYKLASEDDGYWCIYKSSDLPLDIVSNDLFDSSSYVTVKDGQYLKISGCTAVPVR